MANEILGLHFFSIKQDLNPALFIKPQKISENPILLLNLGAKLFFAQKMLISAIFIALHSLFFLLNTFENAPSIIDAPYKTANGKVSFISQAQLETIKAQSSSLKGGIDLEKQTFAFSLPVNTFQGFNSDLQKIHFNENYLESSIFPTATFQGKIINGIPPQKEGVYPVKIVGKFNIHGVVQEKMIEGMITKKGNSIKIAANFTLNVSDFNIPIPKIVEFKISKTVEVKVEADLSAS